MNVRTATTLAAYLTTAVLGTVATVATAPTAHADRVEPQIVHVDHAYRMDDVYVMSQRHARLTAWWRMGSPR